MVFQYSKIDEYVTNIPANLHAIQNYRSRTMFRILLHSRSVRCKHAANDEHKVQLSSRWRNRINQTRSIAFWKWEIGARNESTTFSSFVNCFQRELRMIRCFIRIFIARSCYLSRNQLSVRRRIIRILVEVKRSVQESVRPHFQFIFVHFSTRVLVFRYMGILWHDIFRTGDKFVKYGNIRYKYKLFENRRIHEDL